VALYVITIFSFMAIGYIFFGAVIKIPSIANERFMSLTGNVVMDLEESYWIGESVSGSIMTDAVDEEIYGIASLTRGDETLATETFNLKDVSKKEGDGKYFIEIEDIIDYRFEAAGDYELFLSILDLDLNIKRRFVVE